MYDTKLLSSGWTQSQIDRLDEILESTYNGVDDNGRDLYEYADNLRYARVNSSTEMRLYEEIRDQGCCGSYDETYEHPDGDFMVGFNYGH